VDGMRRSDEDAIEALWETYYPRLKALVARKVAGLRPLISESEVALSAFHKFVQKGREGEFDLQADGNRLWGLLRQFTIFKANDHLKNAFAEKNRMNREAIGQHNANPTDSDGVPRGVDAAMVNNSPSTDIEIADMFENMMGSLSSDMQRDVVLLKLQGASTAAIAEMCQISLRQTQKMLKQIEDRWQDKLLRP
jgi:hypothetical protein